MVVSIYMLTAGAQPGSYPLRPATSLWEPSGRDGIGMGVQLPTPAVATAANCDCAVARLLMTRPVVVTITCQGMMMLRCISRDGGAIVFRCILYVCDCRRI
jgi:hypothetical protein